MNDVTPAGRYPCDMHCHTTRSDGADTPEELIAEAVLVGMVGVAITDHDVPPPLEIEGRDSVEYAAERDVRLILGYEFSCDKSVDDVHICGYRLDWSHPELLAEVDAAARSKSDAYRELCGRLSDFGMPVDWENDILHGVDPAGRLVKRTPEEVQRKHIFEAMERLGHAASWSDAKLLVRDNPDLNVKRRKIEATDAVRLIHACGGIAVLAHPYLIDERIDVPDRPATRDEYINVLIDAGLDGIESRYTYDKTTYKGEQTPEEIEAEVVSKYARRVRFLSGGSDYHADQKKAAGKVRYLGERGLTLGEFELAFENG